MNKFHIIWFIFIIISCQKPDTVETYVVPAGEHKTKNRWVSPEKNYLKFKFTVDNTWYWENGLSKSKVYGLSFSVDPQKYSVRLGTKIIDDEINLYMFCHNGDKDKPVTHNIGKVTPGTYYCELGFQNQNFYLTFQDTTYFIKCDKNLKQAVLCYPYIGGNYTINHDWYVIIDRL